MTLGKLPNLSDSKNQQLLVLCSPFYYHFFLNSWTMPWSGVGGGVGKR